MKWSECKKIIGRDLFRLSGKKGYLSVIRYLITNASFKITFWLRVGNYLTRKKFVGAKVLLALVLLIHKHNQYKTGIQISIGTDVGEGLVFAHYSCIVVHKNAVIGNDCTIYQGCTIGGARGAGGGTPKIGDRVVLTAHAQVIGNVHIGDDVVIGANAVVVTDIPDGTIAVGIPAKVINLNGRDKVKYYI